MPTRVKPASTRGRQMNKRPGRDGGRRNEDGDGEGKHLKAEVEDSATGVKRRSATKPTDDETREEGPPAKKTRNTSAKQEVHNDTGEQPSDQIYQTGTIERGHIYFFYRPKVQLEEVHSVDDVQRFYIVLVPRPPEFSQPSDTGRHTDEEEMQVLSEGADAIPAPATTNERKKRFRLLTVGKKSLPDPNAGGGKGKGRKGVFWAMVTTVGDDLKKLQEGLGEKDYETKTRGARHQGPARLAARGAYAIVNAEAQTPSQRETHLGYHLSHPTSDNFGDVQKSLGILPASSFVLQVKNPLAPNTGGARVGLPGNRRAKFPEHVMKEVFGTGVEGGRGRESYGLKFASVESDEMLGHEDAEFLLIAARAGEDGLDKSLGEGRGEALKETEQSEGRHSINTVLKELAMDSRKIPAEPLEGHWE